MSKTRLYFLVGVLLDYIPVALKHLLTIVVVLACVGINKITLIYSFIILGYLIIRLLYISRVYYKDEGTRYTLMGYGKRYFKHKKKQ